MGQLLSFQTYLKQILVPYHENSLQAKSLILNIIPTFDKQACE